MEFIDRLWPDFSFLDFARCIIRFQRREGAQRRLRQMCVDHIGGKESQSQVARLSQEESERASSSKAASAHCGDTDRRGAFGTHFLAGLVSWPLSLLSGWHFWLGFKPQMPLRSSSDHVPTWLSPLVGSETTWQSPVVGSGTKRCSDPDSDESSIRVAEFSRKDWVESHLHC